MSTPVLVEPQPLPAATFPHRLLAVTLSVFLPVLLYHLVRELRPILQPLLIAFFLTYLIMPAHTALVRLGVPPRFGYAVFVLLLVLVLFALGMVIYNSLADASERLPHYERRLREIVEDLVKRLPWEREQVLLFIEELPVGSNMLINTLNATLGRFLDFFTWMVVTFIYLMFLLAEKVSFPKRLVQAFGVEQGTRVMAVTNSVNQAIAEYIAVKTLLSVIAGVLSMLVLGLFGIDFFVLWGLLIFILNFIPYLGSLVAVTLPIVLSFVQLDQLWQSLTVTALLIAVQVLITLIEPKLAGQKLNVSPLLILLSLAFWGLVWGVVGMILAVPLVVTTKIILDNIPETKSLATLMSHVE